MVTFTGHCPHCGSDRGFKAFGMGNYTVCDYDYSGMAATDRKIMEEKRKNNPNTQFPICGECFNCHAPVIGIFKESMNAQKGLRDCVADVNRTNGGSLKPVKLYPEPTPPYSHPSLPEDVRQSFIDLQKMLQQNLQPHFIITGCRTVLESAIKLLGGEGSSLKKRIDDLRAQGIITTVLHEWASHVRLSGNDAAHEMKSSPKEAKELVEFTKVFLQFTFELPSRITAVRTTTP